VPSEPVTSSSTAGTGPLARLAPEVGAAFDHLQAEVWAAPWPERSALVDLRIAQLLGHDPEPGDRSADVAPVPAVKRQHLSRWPTSPLFTEDERACLGFTEQFVIDVAGIDAQLRLPLESALGPAGMLDFVVALFALDYGRRVTMVLDQLFPDEVAPGSGGVAEGRGPEGGSPGVMVLLGAFDQLSRTIALLDSLDPVTTELVRLRGARQHNCRLCQSTRSARALDAGADEALFDATERYEASDLAECQKVALRLTDAVITQPGSVDGVLAAQVHQWFTPPQVVELVMDVMRNSGQKIAVAMAADDPHLTTGIERFEITANGDVEYLD
jgi:hypothetical protein